VVPRKGEIVTVLERETDSTPGYGWRSLSATILRSKSLEVISPMGSTAKDACFPLIGLNVIFIRSFVKRR
jgi:hypothetical protein